jgi:hypothetical protein
MRSILPNARILLPREMENISRGPTFGDFVTILTERSMQDVTVARSQIIFMVIGVHAKKCTMFLCHRESCYQMGRHIRAVDPATQ